MNCFCTIITANYLPYAKVLHRSISRFAPGSRLEVLVVDAEKELTARVAEGIRLHPLPSILHSPIAERIYKKYAGTGSDQLRWALKPVFVLTLLEQYDKVIFTDPDIYFTGDPAFLFDELDLASILLAPHWSEVDPSSNEDGLFSVMRNGLYSGGFIGSTKGGKAALQWWADACHYKMEKRKELGVYDDQKYLDLLPLINENTAVLRHPGCNLTNISLTTCRRSLENGKLRLNGTFDPIFIHFTRDTIHNISNGNDPLLQPYLLEYANTLREEGLHDGPQEINGSIFHSVKRRLLLRTRLKRFLFRLAEKL
jgi:hypothetical protein